MFNGLGTTEMVLFGIIALMLFGSRLPEVARSFGGTYRELRKKVDDFQREFRDWDRAEPTINRLPAPKDSGEADSGEPQSPKFVPPADDD
tara:strand:+ start:170 stop:439 length:270 start_codon:yes stop_codon:yes gene_type:complete